MKTVSQTFSPKVRFENVEAANRPFNLVVYQEIDNIGEEVGCCCPRPNDSPQLLDESGCWPMKILSGCF